MGSPSPRVRARGSIMPWAGAGGTGSTPARARAQHLGMSNRPVLYIGNTRYSSWSLRPWLALRKSGIELDTVVIPLDTREFVEQVAQVSPMPTVPVLHVDDLVVWDSLAISEWAAERSPRLWPADPGVRAVARSLAASMHSD